MYRFFKNIVAAAIAGVGLLAQPAAGQAQETGTVRGMVTLTVNGGAVHGAVVLIVGTGLVGH